MVVNLQPSLTGETLRLRPLNDDDFEQLFAVAADPLLWEQHPARDRYRKAVFEEFFQSALASKGALVVFYRASGDMIGSSRYYGYSEDRNEVEIGWTFLARSHWGGTCNRELKYLMLRHAFGFVGQVVFRVGVTNVRSQRAMERIGGKRIGQEPDAAGNDSYVYRITRAEFDQQTWV